MFTFFTTFNKILLHRIVASSLRMVFIYSQCCFSAEQIERKCSEHHETCSCQDAGLVFMLYVVKITVVVIKNRACAQTLLICVIMESTALMEEQSMPFRKCGLLKCQSLQRTLFKRFKPLLPECTFSPFSYLMFYLL